MQRIPARIQNQLNILISPLDPLLQSGILELSCQVEAMQLQPVHTIWTKGTSNGELEQACYSIYCQRS